MTDSAPDITAPVRPRISLLPGPDARRRLRAKRARRDKLARWGITAAGFSVVLALTTIFAYLFYEVTPVLRGASVTPQALYTAPAGRGRPVHLLLERYQTFGVQYTDQAEAIFFDADTGALRSQVDLPVPEGASVSSFGAGEPISSTVAYGFSNGQALLASHTFGVSFPDDVRVLTPRIDYPRGTEAVQVDSQGQALTLITAETMARSSGNATIVALTEDGRLVLATLNSRSNLLTGEVQTTHNAYELPTVPGKPDKLLLDKSLGNLFVVDTEGYVHYYDISIPAQGRLVESVNVGHGQRVTAAEFLVGTVSLVFGTDAGELSQWFLVRDEQNAHSLEHIRDFRRHVGAITHIAPEYTRKGFLAVDDSGQLGIHYGTSARTLFLKSITDVALDQVAVSQVNARLLARDENNQIISATLWNEHPQLSWSALWNKVWYEGRTDPEYIWQSTSASDEFESKFSLVPLTVGTLKAAFYAMLFAMPLAIGGAIYTAYFMTPRMRGVVKPTIEIMEALPTVILGFLAGLWLAPFVENNLPAVFSFFLLMPIAMLVFAFLWSRLPAGLRNRVPDGWEAALLIPVILGFGILCVQSSPWVEVWFFNGSMRQWFTDIGITYDQRNALIVGIAMGFAVIPTIFSIAEDAVFTVPGHLSQGSLALGATRWQTIIGVVLPTASPGIFSAIMMGFGRAVGETMIVLMATGNSPIVNFNIFEGMRTLSANIAVELPETAVGSSHFRVLFLAALVLLAITFVVNTLAEIVRQRLRQRYSNL